MRFAVPAHFRHAAEIRSPLASRDPRNKQFNESAVDVDLRDCEFLRPAAVLWCLLYPLLAKATGAKVRLLVPQERGVCTYLKSVGLFEILKGQDVEVDDRGIRERKDPQLVLRLTPFRTLAYASIPT